MLTLAMSQVQIDINLIKTAQFFCLDFDICSFIDFPFQDYVPNSVLYLGTIYYVNGKIKKNKKL